jgi:hypothetical protein
LLLFQHLFSIGNRCCMVENLFDPHRRLLELKKLIEAQRTAPKFCKICSVPLNAPRRVFCKPCVDQGRDRVTYKGLYRGLYRKRKTPQPRPCPRCGMNFMPHHNAQKYCTRQCGASADSERRSILRGKSCQHCGKAIEGRPRKFCDALCRSGRAD